MENIDDFMRQKFDSDDPGERFEFREEYWEQAQTLLEKEEDKRRRRFWLFIGLVLAMALLAWLLLVQGPAGSLSQNKIGERDSTFSAEKTEHPSYTDEKDTLSGQTTESSNYRGQTNEALNQGDEKLSNSTIPGALSLGNMPETIMPGNTKSKSSKNIAEARTSKGLASIEASQKSLEGKTDEGNAGDTEKTQKEITKLDDKSTNSPITSSPAVASAKAGPPVTIPLTILPTPLTPIALPERIFQPRKNLAVAKEPIAEKIKPVKDRRFSFGLSLAGAAYQPSDTVGRRAGWTLGAFGDYRLNKNWSLELGVKARFVPGYAAPEDSSNPNQVENLRYSFGFRSEKWKRETRGLHYLEVPLSVHWYKGPWALEGGAAAGMLLWVQNRTEYTVESSLESAKTTVKKFVKGNSEPYNQSYFSAFAGAEYRLNNRFSLTTRAQYRFTPIFRTLGEGVKNDGLGNMELGLRLRLF